MNAVFSLLCLLVMVIAIVKSENKPRTLLHGALSVVGTLAVVWLISFVLKQNVRNNMFSAIPLLFLLPASVMWIYARKMGK